MMLMRVTWVDYTPKQDDGESYPTIRVCGRSADGERAIKYVDGTLPHCYVPADASISTAMEEEYDVQSVEEGFETHDGDSVKKVYTRHPKQINGLKEEFEWTAEADIPYYRRATWDYGLSGYIRVPEHRRFSIEEAETDIDPTDVETIEPRIVIGDIEVASEVDKSFDEMQEAKEDPIVACSLHDTYSEEFVLGIVDPDGVVEGSAIKEEMAGHWGNHEMADRYLNGNISLVRCETEADLLNSVIARIQDWQPDLISGWNWIDFDHEYLTERAKTLDDVDEHKLSDLAGVGGRKVETVIKGLPAFDEMEAFDDKISWSENRSLSLEYVASEEIGIGKIDAVDVSSAYQNDRTRLAAYNLLDVQLCVAITEKHAIEEFYLDLAELSGLQVYDCYYEKRLVDGFIATRKGDDQILPNQADRDIVTPAGGLVLSPSDGVEDHVAVIDLKSLYPSSMITCNISPETMTEFEDMRDLVVPGMPEKEDDVGGSITEENINWERNLDLPWSMTAKWFWLGKQGILPEFVAELFVERERYKRLRDQHDPSSDEYDVYDRKQRAIKVIMNSFYGVSNSPYYRLALDGIGDAITGVSRYVLWRGAKKAEEVGYDVIYGDTDSVLVKIPGGRSLEDMILDAKGLTNQLNDHMSSVADDLGIPKEHPYLSEMDLHGTDQHCWTWEFEKFYDSFIQVGSKKRYAGRLSWKEGKKIDDVDITGFESQRADVPQLTAEVQTNVIERVLGEADFSDVSGYVRGEIEDIRQFAHPEEIGIPKSISKPLDEYPNRERVRAARHANQFLGQDFGPGDTPWMYYVNRTPVGVEGTDVIAVDWNADIPEGYEINEEKTIVKAFESALSPIIEEVGWTFEEIREGKQVVGEEATDFDGDPFGRDDEPVEPESGVSAW